MTAQIGPVEAPLVLEVVADAFHVSQEDLLGPSRVRVVLEARRVAYRLLHDECWLGWASVADLMNVRVNGSMVDTAAAASPPMVDLCRERIRRMALDR